MWRGGSLVSLATSLNDCMCLSVACLTDIVAPVFLCFFLFVVWSPALMGIAPSGRLLLWQINTLSLERRPCKRVMTVTEVMCDPNCDESSGCSVRGEGKCDSNCVSGYVLDRNTYTCKSKYCNYLSWISQKTCNMSYYTCWLIRSANWLTFRYGTFSKINSRLCSGSDYPMCTVCTCTVSPNTKAEIGGSTSPPQ